MEDQLIRTADQSEAPFPTIRTVPMLAALDWLRKGLDDAKAAPKASLFYGLCFAAMGFLISFVFRNAYHLTSGLTAGFLLVGPYFAIGLYELSRRRERGEPLDLGPTLTVWRKHMANVGVFSLILTVIFLVWARASMVVFALFYTQEMPTLDSFLRQLIGLENLEFMFAYFAVGLLFASIVFAISVVSIPMMYGQRAGQRYSHDCQHHRLVPQRRTAHALGGSDRDADGDRYCHFFHWSDFPDAHRRPRNLARLSGSGRAAPVGSSGS